ncbi:MipA/OmpV family protein [Planctobacterium marinum]|uniref:Structural protein MipA n=1 Tax=Planctobacterium marinum TaxID=1631968 RepID=A0AA48HM89_9ALTE|nr:structural protein MipA [Planctobacterium marinum]
MRILTAGLLSAALLLSTESQAKQQHMGWGVGLAAIVQDQGYRGGDAETQIFPMVFYQGQHFYWQGPELGYRVANNFTLFAEYRFDGFELDDSDFFAGMEERKGSLDLGAAYKFETKLVDLTLSGQADVLSEHEGYEFSATLSKGFPALGGRLTPSLEVSYLSDSLVDYYYGVRTSEATDLRPEYIADNTVNVSLGISGMWPVTDNQNIIAAFNYSILGSEIEDSPLMEEGESSNLFVGYVYRF